MVAKLVRKLVFLILDLIIFIVVLGLDFNPSAYPGPR